ncbi:MAG: malto-oligosyltrehalose trehalohydrolase [Chitinophagaceae bacterium]
MEKSKKNIGVTFNGGKAEVKVWAPLLNKVELELTEKRLKILLIKDEWGYWQTETAELQPGDLYRFVLDGDQALPDPASLSQPQGVHGPSQAMDIESYNWSDAEWKAYPLESYILYELHTGTFTPEGTFAGIEQKLDYLVDLGINAIEIMPVAQFPGSRNWGYDGVFPFAVQDSYGGAEGLQKLVDACHSKGIAVVLDVVYNHMGPEGNYLGAYGPYFTDKYSTPWGNALNFDDAYCDGVRHFFIENALMWLRDFRIDALRLDAVHAIKDFSATHFLRELKEKTDVLMQETGRRHYLITELDLNDTRFIAPLEKGGFGMDAQWIDEFHHALRVTAGGEKTGYYADFNGIEHLAKAYKDAYVYDGQYSPHRKKKFGIKATEAEGKQFVVFSQNHDQVGNRMLGERSSQLFSFEMQKLLAAAVLTAPYLPMLFMGEEWSEPAPFQYFVSHTDAELAEAVRKGRKEEFEAFHAEGEAPDPMAEETFNNSKLQWHLAESGQHKTALEYYKTLIQLRKSLPALSHLERQHVEVVEDKEAQTLVLRRWHDGQQVVCCMNFSKKEQPVSLPAEPQTWFLALASADRQWGGTATTAATLKGNKDVLLPPESATIYVSTQVHLKV